MSTEKEMWQDLQYMYREDFKKDAIKKYPNLVRLPPYIYKKMPLDKKVEKIEKFLSKWCLVTGTERLMAVNFHGYILVDALGDKYTVPLLNHEEDKISKLGSIIIHCHPSNSEEETINTISPNDIALLYKLGIQESRVVYKSTVYIWSRGKKRISKKTVIKRMEEINNLLNTNKITTSDYQEKLINNLADEFGAEYYQKQII